MPTVNPRVNVTLSPSSDALVTRLAGLQGVSKSQVLRELLDAAEPALQRVAVLMEAAHKSRGEVLDGLAQSLQRAQDHIEGAVAAHLVHLEAAAGVDLVAQAEAVVPRRRARPAKRADLAVGDDRRGVPSSVQTPGPVTRGSGLPTAGISSGKTRTRRG